MSHFHQSGRDCGKRLLEIDGSQKSGSGTILRLSIAMSAILLKPLHLYNIRQKRPKPGLKHQHLRAVLTAANICKANVKGAKVGSKELWFFPTKIVGGRFHAEIGTAGSIPMLLMTVLPICTFARNPVCIDISRGGTDVSYSPTINYLKYVFLPVLAKMGLKCNLTIHRYGYYPKGLGRVTLKIQPNQNLLPLHLEKFGRLRNLRGISVCTFLANQQVAKRQAKEAAKTLTLHGYESNMEVVNDYSNPEQKGSSITLLAQTDSNVLLGSDAIGELGKPSETIGRNAAENLIREIKGRGTVDSHLADMLIPYVALVKGESVFTTSAWTNHLETNIWLTHEILKVKFRVEKTNKLFKITKNA